ncbi:UbiA family prenyltransferase [Polymorphospora sp. NPDC051019]|uniref:UbiA family prenyltransferase n=1 Tax=Polymorphospora sp. NPDC051019 TaxID=3155725 RepID=UPI0034361CA3
MTAVAGRRHTTLIAHVQTWRPYTLWYVGLLGLAGAGLGGGDRDWWRLLAAWATPTIGWIGGHYLGDYFDRRLDAISKAHRPIPSGRLRPQAALGCGVACFVGVGALAIAGGLGTGLVAVLAAIGIVAYGKGLKARGLSGNLARGALGTLAMLYGALVVAPVGWWPLVAFAVAFWAHDTASNLVGTIRDVAGDRAGGYRTVPVRHGDRIAAGIALLFYLAAVAAAAVGGLVRPVDSPLTGGRGGYLVLLALTAAVGFAAFATLLPRRDQLSIRTALRAHELLVLERIGFAGAAIGLGFGLLPAVVLVVPALTVSWWTQARMRAAYELGPPAPPAGATGPSTGAPPAGQATSDPS